MDRNQFINLQKNYIDQGDLCDVHFWQMQAQRRWIGLTAEDINQFETWFDEEKKRKGWVDPALIAKYFDAKIKDKNS